MSDIKQPSMPILLKEPICSGTRKIGKDGPIPGTFHGYIDGEEVSEHIFTLWCKLSNEKRDAISKLQRNAKIDNMIKVLNAIRDPNCKLYRKYIVPRIGEPNGWQEVSGKRLPNFEEFEYQLDAPMNDDHNKQD